MRVLIAPMAAMAETRGPISRARAFARELVSRGHDVAFCAAEDVNYRPVEGVPNFAAPLPSPFGAPLLIGKGVFRLVQALGIQRRKTVHSFEEVLYMVGATDKRFFARDVAAIREAIRTFSPDAVHAEFRIAAIVAARLEGIPVSTGYSYPVQPGYRANPELAEGVRAFLGEHDLPQVKSALEIFGWADLKLVASSYELEPIEGDDVVHVGPMLPLAEARNEGGSGESRNIVAYPGNGTLSARRLLEVLRAAFAGTDYRIYLASTAVKQQEYGNIHVDRSFDFDRLLPDAAAFIHHGGQNSVMTGLLHGVPQLVVPGRVFERRYNAESVRSLGAAVVMEPDELTPARLSETVTAFEKDASYRDAARRAGDALDGLGGARQAAEELVSISP